jgi:hypothetical protein
MALTGDQIAKCLYEIIFETDLLIEIEKDEAKQLSGETLQEAS